MVTAHSRVTTIAALTGQKIGVNGVNSIGTLLISAMLTFGVLGPQYAARVRQGTLVRSMIGPGS